MKNELYYSNNDKMADKIKYRGLFNFSFTIYFPNVFVMTTFQKG